MAQYGNGNGNGSDSDAAADAAADSSPVDTFGIVTDTPAVTTDVPIDMLPVDYIDSPWKYPHLKPLGGVVLTPVPTSTNPYTAPTFSQITYPSSTTVEVTELEETFINDARYNNNIPQVEKNEIGFVNVDLSDIPGNGSARRISVSGGVGTPFSMTIKDMYGNNMLAPVKKYSRSVKLTTTSSQLVNVSNTDYLEVGMQLRGPGVGDGVTISSIKDDKNIIISKPQTISANTSLTFSGGGLLDDAVIPRSGTYSFNQSFPKLRTYIKILKEAASSTTILTLDSTINLEIGMRMSGAGVDGEYVTIESIDSDTQITVSVAQTIADETTLIFTMSYNRYSILIRPYKGSALSSSIPHKIPTYHINQYINPVVAFVPTITLASSTVTGTVSLSKPIGHKPFPTPSSGVTPLTSLSLPRGTTAKNEGLVTISMTATSTSGGFKIDRQPRFSSTDSTLSDFTNTNIIKKQISVYSGVETPIVVLNNTTDLTVGMRVVGGGIVQPVIPTDCEEVQSPVNPDYKDVTIKSITGNTVTLSWPQTLPCEGTLAFNNGGTSVFIENLTAVLSEKFTEGSAEGKVADGVCTVTGTGHISKFGKDSTTCTIDFDNFLSKA